MHQRTCVNKCCRRIRETKVSHELTLTNGSLHQAHKTWSSTHVCSATLQSKNMWNFRLTNRFLQNCTRRYVGCLSLSWSKPIWRFHCIAKFKRWMPTSIGGMVIYWLRWAVRMSVCVFMTLITTLVLCAGSQDLVMSVSVRRVPVVLSTAGWVWWRL